MASRAAKGPNVNGVGRQLVSRLQMRLAARVALATGLVVLSFWMSLDLQAP